MKVILLQDVAKLGRKFTTIEVPDGHALNKLIPQGLAQQATPENVKRLSTQMEKVSSGEDALNSLFDDAVTKLSDSTIMVPVELNEQGHMFQALKGTVIIEALSEAGVSTEGLAIEISEPIKESGDHTVFLMLGTKKAPLTISVISK